MGLTDHLADWKETDVVGRHHWSEGDQFQLDDPMEATEGRMKRAHSGWSAGIQWIRRN